MPGAASEQLPSSSLVSIVAPSDQKQSYGVMAISSYGQLRYWPRLTEPHRCTDATISLSSDETCATLKAVPTAGYYVLATTTGRIVLISLQGSHLVMQREIRASSSVLSTVGSWLGFGSKKNPSAAQDAEDPLVGVRITSHLDYSLLWVLKPNSLVVWLLQSGRESLILNTNLMTDFEASLLQECQEQYGVPLALHMTVCDFQVYLPPNASQGSLLLLVGSSLAEEQQGPGVTDELLERAFEDRGDRQYHLATYQLNVRGSSSSGSTSIKQQLLDAPSLLPEEVALSQEWPALLLPTEEPVPFVYWHQFAFYAIQSSETDVHVEIKDVTHNPSHRIFGATSTSQAALFFTPAYGIVKLQPVIVADEVTQTKDTRGSYSKHSTNAASAQAPSGFMAQASAHDILAEAFHRYMAQPSNQHLSSPSPNYPWTSLVETLWKLDFETAIQSFSEQIADSRPAEDPRWPEYSARMMGGSKEADHSYNSTLYALLCRQIEDKQDLYRNFTHFLREIGLWNELSITTKDTLEQVSEKFACAVQLRSKHNECIRRQSGPSPAISSHPSIFQQAIESSLIASGTSRAQWERAGLSAQDIYYAKISGIESILAPALAALKAQLGTKLSLESQFQLITQTNDIFQSVFSSAILARSQLSPEFYDLAEEDEAANDPEFVRATLASTSSELGAPWTRTHNHLLREVIRIARQFAEQVQQSKATSAPAANGRSLGSAFSSSALDIDLPLLNDQLYYLTDALLSDWYQELVRLEIREPNTFTEFEKSFASLRADLLAPFKAIPTQHELGLQLAAKYREFLVIVEICELQEDAVKLWNYAAQFSNLGFERVVFEFFYVNKQYYKLLTPPRAYWTSLRQYLDTTGINALSWNHLVRTGDYAAAEHTFEFLAEAELDSAAKQTTFLSLAKLSELASGTPVSEVNEEREQRLYLRDAQRSVTAMLDHSDDDGIPLSAASLISRLIDVSAGTVDLEPGASLRLSLDLFSNTTLLRSEIENHELLLTIWTNILSFEQWSVLAASVQRGELDDEALQENVQNSFLISAGLEVVDITDALPVNIFLTVARSLYGDDPAALRILVSAFDLLYRARGASPPDLSSLFDDAAMATEDAEPAENGDLE